MNTFFSILLKNGILLALIVISLVFIYSPYIGFKEVWYIFYGLGSAFLIAACFEAYYLAQVKIGTRKFEYLTYGFLAKRFIKVISFICIGTLLYYSGRSIIKYLAFVCFLIAFTEIIVTIWRKWNNSCFVALEDDQLILASNKMDVTSAKEIEKIEFRHGLMYFVNYNKKVIRIRADLMIDKEEFKLAMDQWIINNGLSNKLITN